MPQLQFEISLSDTELIKELERLRAIPMQEVETKKKTTKSKRLKKKTDKTPEELKSGIMKILGVSEEDRVKKGIISILSKGD